MRKYYMDNLRWSIILLLIPFHAAQAFKTWTEPNYIEFGPDRVISSVIVFFGPFIMQLLFLFAGMSIRFALKKRTYGEFAIERIKRLLIPLVFGVLVLVPPMTCLADIFHNGYSGSIFTHYRKFFTELTDMSGADGGFSFGQFWFLLYLFILSFLLLGVVALQKNLCTPNMRGKRAASSGPKEIDPPLIVIIALGLPLPIFSELLSVGGKSFVEFFWFLLIGYYIFTSGHVENKLKKYGLLFLIIGIVAGVINVYLFVFAGDPYPIINSIAINLCKWFMVLGLFGAGSRYFDREGRVSRYFTAISYPFFSFHFVFVILFQFLFADVFRDNYLLLYTVPVCLSYIATLLFSQLAIKIPVLGFLTGTKRNSDRKK